MVKKVNHQSFDVRAILILVSHDEQPAVPKAAQLRSLGVFLTVMEAQDLDDVGDLLVVHQLQTQVTGREICFF